MVQGFGGVAHPGVELGDVRVLQLHGAVASQGLVEMLASSAKGLTQRDGLRLQSLGMRTLDLFQKPLVEGVAVAGDVGQEGGQAGVRIVGARAAAADAGPHEHDADEHGPGLIEELGGGNLAWFVQAAEDCVEGDLRDHETAVSAGIVDAMRIPLAEMVVGAFVHRVVEVVGTGINSQLLQPLRIEPGLG